MEILNIQAPQICRVHGYIPPQTIIMKMLSYGTTMGLQLSVQGLAAFPLCIENYRDAAVATGWVMMVGACGDDVGVTIGAGKTPI